MARSQKLSNIPNAPAFSAYRATDQSISSGAWTKLQAATESFDTAAAYDNATNYRFTPLVAGYYQVNGAIYVNAVSGLTNVGARIYKNGSANTLGTICGSASSAEGGALVSDLIYMNGTTDYIELFGYCTGTTLVFKGGADFNHFSAVLVRPA